MTVTRYEYDDFGRMVRSIAVTESDWSREDVAALVASRLSERERDANGILLSEAFDPANQFAFQGQEAPKVNWAEKTRLDLMDAFYKKHDKKGAPVNRNGHSWSVTKRDSSGDGSSQ